MLSFFKQRILKVLSVVFMLMLGVGASSIFPPFNQVLLGYICLIIFFSTVLGIDNNKKAFFYCYLFGFSFFAVGFSWVCNALLVDEEEFATYVPVVFMAMGLFFSLFISIPYLFIRFGKNIYAKGLIWCLSIVLFEWIRSFIFTDFPWNLFGTALGYDEVLIQGASVVGTYGLSLMLLLFVMGFSILLLGVIKKKNYSGGLFFILIPVMLFLVLGGTKKDFEDGDIKVRLVQPSIPQTLKWNSSMLYQNFRSYIDLSKSKPLDGVDLVVWGETATPYPLDFDQRRLNEITEAIDKDGFLITGLIRFSLEQGEYVSYNSMFAIDGNGVIKDYYDKAHLVPFGEYMPLKEYMPDFMKPVADVVGNLKKGEKFKNITVKGLPLMGGAICYESIFPKGVVNSKIKPEVLVVLANDGWYGISAGPYQHLVATQMRAIEEGITIIRSANSGISAVIKPNGEIVGVIGLNEKGISDVVLPKKLSVDTIYGKYGNLILLMCFVFGVMVTICLNKFIKTKK